jgi:hypothetical protein
MCHIPKVFGNPHPSCEATAIAPNMFYTNGDIAMGCQVFCLCEVGIDIPTGPVGDDHYRVVFSGQRIVHPKWNLPFTSKCATFIRELKIRRGIASWFCQIEWFLNHVFIDPLR